MVKSGLLTKNDLVLHKDNVIFNFKEIEKYISFQIKMEERTQKGKINHRSVLRQC
jgi:hypothetical protein